MFEWDDAKRQTNVDKHGLDFIRADLMFDGRPALTVRSTHAGEERFVTIAFLDGRFATLIWTWRGDMRRAISLRRARDDEQRAYRALHG